MNRSELKAIIIGTGMIAQVHFRSLKSAGVHVVGLVDVDKAQATRVAKMWGVSAYKTLNAALMSEDIDVVHVCTPNAFHFIIAKEALEAGKHVVCEKPLATNLFHAQELADLAVQKGVQTAVPFVYRYHPMVREARARILKGEIGQIQLIHGSYLQDWLLEQSDNNWRVDPKQGGASRAFADIGSHWCDLMEWVTGESFVDLVANFHTAQTQRTVASVETFTKAQLSKQNEVTEKVTTEDIATLLLKTNQGTPACLTISQVSAGRKNRLWFEVNGSQSSVEFDQEKPEQLWVSDRQSRSMYVRDPAMGSAEQQRLSVTPAGHAQGYSHCFEAFISDFYDTILGVECEGLPTFQDGLRAAKIIDTAIISSKERSWIEVR